jgi:outer membrane protein insertion porin family
LRYYQDRGYVDATILDVVRQVNYNADKDQDELTLIFQIKEGSQLNYGGMVISGNTIFTTEELLALVTIKEGTVFNQTKFSASLPNAASE